MKQFLQTFVLTLLLVSCSERDNPFAVNKDIGEIDGDSNRQNVTAILTGDLALEGKLEKVFLNEDSNGFFNIGIGKLDNFNGDVEIKLKDLLHQRYDDEDDEYKNRTLMKIKKVKVSKGTFNFKIPYKKLFGGFIDDNGVQIALMSLEIKIDEVKYKYSCYDKENDKLVKSGLMFILGDTSKVTTEKLRNIEQGWHLLVPKVGEKLKFQEKSKKIKHIGEVINIFDKELGELSFLEEIDD